MDWLKAFFWFCVVFNIAYYRVARQALDALKAEDAQAYGASGAVGGVSARNSFAIIKILFDTELPKRFHSTKFKRLMVLARTMLGVGLVLLALLLVLIGINPPS